MNNNQWGENLRAAYQHKISDPSGIRLPAPSQIVFDGEKDCVKVIMKEKAVVANMATNGAAFEAWSLALRVWCGVDAVELKWDRPSDRVSLVEQCHYQRFLFRAERFGALCGDWFRLAEPALLSDAEALGTGPFFLNVPGDRTAMEDPDDTGGESDEGRESDAKKRLLESETEKRLVKCESFELHFRLAKGKTDRQLPVGLFRNRVARENRIFTGGKSAIDLVGVGGGTLSIFELKTGDNIPAGILSELLFYASVIRDAIPVPARFQFDPTKPSRGPGVSAGDVMRCAGINAVLLGDQFHPLVGHRDIINHLNKAADEHWNKEPGRVPVHFRAVLLKRSDDKFAFEDVAP